MGRKKKTEAMDAAPEAPDESAAIPEQAPEYAAPEAPAVKPVKSSQVKPKGRAKPATRYSKFGG